MTINEAIEILTDIKEADPELYGDDEQDALKLGIEALKRFNKMRHGMAEPIYYLLPGETKE